MSGLPAVALRRAAGVLAERLRPLLEEGRFEALLVVARSARDPDLAPFVGGAHLGESVLVVPRDGEPRLAFLSSMERDEAASTGLALLTPDELEIGRLSRQMPTAESLLAALIERALSLCGMAPATSATGSSTRIALAGHPAAGALHEACKRLEANGWSFQDGAGMVLRVRKGKSAEELAAARGAAAGTVEAMWRVATLLASTTNDQSGALVLGGEPLRVGRLRAEIALVLARHGLEQPEGNLLACGSDAGVPHNQGSDERLVRSGEVLLVDLFPKRRLFADCTRTFCVGEPSDRVRRAHDAVLAALLEAHAAARPGGRGFALQQLACATLAAAGYPTPLSHPGTTVGYVHGLGHGVGYELHEEPSFRKESGAEGILEVGDLLTLEPGLYDPAPGSGYGVRLEDLVWLGEAGPENLTPLPYDLDPRAWRR